MRLHLGRRFYLHGPAPTDGEEETQSPGGQAAPRSAWHRLRESTGRREALRTRFVATAAFAVGFLIFLGALPVSLLYKGGMLGLFVLGGALWIAAGRVGTATESDAP